MILQVGNSVTKIHNPSNLPQIREILSFKVPTNIHILRAKMPDKPWWLLKKIASRGQTVNLLDLRSLTLPTGLVKRVVDYCGTNHVPLTVRDARDFTYGTDRNWYFTKALRDYQKEPAEAALRENCGILNIATRGGKCINKNSLCLTSEGLLDFNELGTPLKPLSFIESKISVSSPFEPNGTDVTTHLYNDGKRKSISVTTRHGFQETGTPNHCVRTIQNGKIDWKSLSNLKIGNFVVHAKEQNIWSCNSGMSLDDAYWYGILTGDGSTTVPKRLSISTEDEHIINFCVNYLHSKGKNPHVYPDKRRNKLVSVVVTDSDFYQKHVNNNLIHRAENKRVPLCVRKSTKDRIALFLRGLFETDGWVEPRPAVCLSSSSFQLIQDVRMLLLNYGIVTHYRCKKTPRKPAHTISIHGKYCVLFDDLIGLDPKGIKYIRLKKALTFKRISCLTTDIIPVNKQKMRSIRDTLMGILNLTSYNLKTIKTIGEFNYGTLRSWDEPSSKRFPVRSYLVKYLMWAKTLIQDPKILSYIQDTLLICSEKFFYSPVRSKKIVLSDNADFVIPVSNTFVANGFINHNTVLAQYITAKIKLPTLFFVNSLELLNQAHKSFQKAFPLKRIGRIGEGILNPQEITIATVQTLLKDKEIFEDLYDYFRVVFFDEIHHFGGLSFYRTAMKFDAPFRFGLSGTAFRNDEAGITLNAICGEIISKVSTDTLVQKGVVYRTHIIFQKCGTPPHYPPSGRDFHKLYEWGIVTNPYRNALILEWAKKLHARGLTVLIIVKMIEHGKTLQASICKAVNDPMACRFMNGQEGKNVRADTLKRFCKGEIPFLIGTKIYNEGVDFVGLENHKIIGKSVILAAGGRSKIAAIQTAARPTTKEKRPGMLNEALIIDFSDKFHRLLYKHAKERHQSYVNLGGFKISVTDSPKSFTIK